MHGQRHYIASDGRPTLVLGPPPADYRKAPQASRGPSADTTASQRRVLVVEDNLDTVHGLARLLKDDGHRVEFAINGYAALRIAESFRPDVVVLDLGLPGMNGLDVCIQLKAEPSLRRARIIVVTAYADDEHRARARAAGCDTYLVKPYDPVHLLDMVNWPLDKPLPKP